MMALQYAALKDGSYSIVNIADVNGDGLADKEKVFYQGNDPGDERERPVATPPATTTGD